MTTTADKARQATADRQRGQEFLADLLKPGDTVYANVNHVAPSGMTRWISLYVARGSDIIDISWHAAKLIGRPVNTRNHAGIECGGVGMDMGFELVYSLGRALWPEGVPCTGEHCLSNDHVNHWDGPRGEGVVHSESGYALSKRWL
jgi:hypothetical protein